MQLCSISVQRVMPSKSASPSSLFADFKAPSRPHRRDEDQRSAHPRSAFVKKSAWVGAENLPHAFMENFHTFSQREIQPSKPAKKRWIGWWKS